MYFIIPGNNWKRYFKVGLSTVIYATNSSHAQKNHLGHLVGDSLCRWCILNSWHHGKCQARSMTTIISMRGQHLSFANFYEVTAKKCLTEALVIWHGTWNYQSRKWLLSVLQWLNWTEFFPVHHSGMAHRSTCKSHECFIDWTEVNPLQYLVRSLPDSAEHQKQILTEIMQKPMHSSLQECLV